MKRNCKRVISIILAAFFAFSLAACGGGSISGENTAGTTATASNGSDNPETAAASPSGLNAPPEGKDTNNGRPYNLTKVAYDNRNTIYLNGINATILPIVDEPAQFTAWMPFSSTALTDLNDSEVFKEMEKRTNVHINWINPPDGQIQDNYNLVIASDNLPDIFFDAPEYPGGAAKAIDDDIYVDLTPYYDKGYMPNIKFIREDRPDINRDWVDDSGRMLCFSLLDIVPSSPWSGMWVRQDWLDDLGLSVPATIDDWDVMLYAMQKSKTPHPLYLNLPDFFGVYYSYALTGSYETGWSYIRKNGTTVEYGPINEGWRQFLTKMNKWFADGILDPDFATRTYDDCVANIANGKYGGFSMYYGAVGQLNLTGTSVDPKFKMVPVPQPTVNNGQIIHLREFDSTVRSSNRGYVTTKAVDEGLIETICRYMDYLFSQDGGDLGSYGPEGVSYKWNDQGEAEWIYPDLVNNPDADFWTLYPRFKLHGEPPYLRDSTAYENPQEVWDSIKVWGSQDADWVMPDNISQTADEAKELANIEADINTYREEMAYKFITGQTPLSEFDAYVDQMRKMGVDRAVELKQAALDRYNNR